MSEERVRHALQAAWDSCESLPPIIFTEEEADALIEAILVEEGSAK